MESGYFGRAIQQKHGVLTLSVSTSKWFPCISVWKYIFYDTQSTYMNLCFPFEITEGMPSFGMLTDILWLVLRMAIINIHQDACYFVSENARQNQTLSIYSPVRLASPAVTVAGKF